MDMHGMKGRLEDRGFKFKKAEYPYRGITEIHLRKNKEETKMELFRNEIEIKKCKNQTSEMVMVLLKEIETELQKTNEKEIEIKGEISFVTDMEYVNLDNVLMKELKADHPVIPFARKVRDIIEESVKGLNHASFKLKYYIIPKKELNVRIKTMYQEYYLDIRKKGDEEISLESEGKEFVCSYEECETYLKHTLEKEEKNKRLQSVFYKPHPYLSEFLRETYEVSCLTKEMVQKISEKLIQHYKYEEIEEMAKEKRRTKEVKIIYKKGDHHAAMIPFGKTFIVVYDEEVDAGIEKEAYIETLEKKVVEWAFGNKKAAALRNL